MVNSWTNTWTAEKDYSSYPEEKMCDCDRIAKLIMDRGYKVNTTLENLVENIISFYDLDKEGCYQDMEEKYGIVTAIQTYVEDCGGFYEFDYYD